MIAHDVLTFVCARSTGFVDSEIKITPYTYGEDDGDQYNPHYIWELREGGKPAVSSVEDYYDENEYYAQQVRYHASNRGKVSALEVLSLYSAEPDWGMDADLSISPLQKLTGGSQGYRHLRYGLYRFRVGVAHLRALHFNQLADRAFSKGDFYWGMRFSARALHYIEDILSPFHTKPFPEWFWPAKLFRLRALYYITYNYHLNFERYAGFHLWHGSDVFMRCIESSRPYGIMNLRRDLLRVSQKARFLSYGIFRELRKLWGGSMEGGWVKLSKEQAQKLETGGQLGLLTCRWLRLLSQFVKGYIISNVIPPFEEE